MSEYPMSTRTLEQTDTAILIMCIKLRLLNTQDYYVLFVMEKTPSIPTDNTSKAIRSYMIYFGVIASALVKMILTMSWMITGIN